MIEHSNYIKRFMSYYNYVHILFMLYLEDLDPFVMSTCPKTKTVHPHTFLQPLTSSQSNVLK